MGPKFRQARGSQTSLSAHGTKTKLPEAPDGLLSLHVTHQVQGPTKLSSRNCPPAGLRGRAAGGTPGALWPCGYTTVSQARSKFPAPRLHHGSLLLSPFSTGFLNPLLFTNRKQCFQLPRKLSSLSLERPQQLLVERSFHRAQEKCCWL